MPGFVPASQIAIAYILKLFIMLSVLQNGRNSPHPGKAARVCRKISENLLYKA
jgi:hypothetical protein